MPFTAGVLTVSDGCSRGEREDVSGQVLADTLQANGFNVVMRAVLPDEEQALCDLMQQWAEGDCDLLCTTGGTGFAPRDITPEATRRVIEREAPGLAELLRWTGYQKFDRAVLSRGVAGIRGRTLIINLPGSPGGVRDGLQVLLPLLPHAIALLKDEPVDHTPQPERGKREEGRAENTDNLIENRKLKIEISVPPDQTPDTVVVMETNLDDFSPEFYEVLMERLFAAGAVDVFCSPIQMKKNRPATLLSILAPPEISEEIAQTLFVNSTTFGIRYTTMQRFTLERRWETAETEYGPIRIKVGSWRGMDTTASPEYADVKAAAQAHNVPVKTVYAAAQRAAGQTGEPTLRRTRQHPPTSL